MYRVLAVCLCLSSSMAMAQQAPAIEPRPVAPEVQALNIRVLGEINSNIACSTQVIVLERELATLRSDLERLRKVASSPVAPALADDAKKEGGN